MSSSTHQEMLYMGTNEGDEILEPMRSLRGGLNGDEVSSTTIDLSYIAPFLQIAFAILAISFATRCLMIQLNRFVGHWTFERSEGYLSDMWRIRNLILEREREEERSKEPKEERTKRLQEHFKATNVITVRKFVFYLLNSDSSFKILSHSMFSLSIPLHLSRLTRL